MNAGEVLLFCWPLLLRGRHQKAPSPAAFLPQEGVCCRTRNRWFRIQAPSNPRTPSALHCLHTIAVRDLFCCAAEMPLKPLLHVLFLDCMAGFFNQNYVETLCCCQTKFLLNFSFTDFPASDKPPPTCFYLYFSCS